MNVDDEFKIEDYFPAVINEFKALGREVTITKKREEEFRQSRVGILNEMKQ